MGSIPAIPDARIVPSFRCWQFEVPLGPFNKTQVAKMVMTGRIILLSIEELYIYAGFIKLSINLKLLNLFRPNQQFTNLLSISQII